MELARRAKNPGALAHALDGRLYAIVAPDTIDECLELGSELLRTAQKADDAERLLQGHMHCFVAHITRGDVGAATGHLDATSLLAEELRQPVQLWQARGAAAMLAIASGDFDSAATLVEEAYTIGRDAIPAARSHYIFQRFSIHDHHDTLDVIKEEMVSAAASEPARAIFRCAVAYIHARLNRTQIARAELTDLAAHEYAAVPFDMEWLVATSLLAETCALLHSQEHARTLYALVSPYATSTPSTRRKA